MNKLRVYIAGKVSSDSVFRRHNWRDGVCQKLSKLSGIELQNLYSLEAESQASPENDAEYIFGRDCFLIHSADVVIVFLTDDISVGGSQEMLIAKYVRKPLLGIAPQEGKFRKASKEIHGKIYSNWTHPFVAVPCDWLVEDIEQAAQVIKTYSTDPKENLRIKDLDIIDSSIQYYLEKVQKEKN